MNIPGNQILRYMIKAASAGLFAVLNRFFRMFPMKEEQVLFLSDVRAEMGGNFSFVENAMPSTLHSKYYLKADRPRRIIEFDMKHINNSSRKQYALCAIDTYTKEAIIHICSKPTATNGSIAMQKVLDRFGTDITVVCDNGSENFGATFDLLMSQNVRQVFARPHTPKDKPHIENFIGKYQKECLDESRDKCMTVEERQREADKWLNDWHFYRPHQALNYLTPAEYCATIGITILQAKSVSDVVS